MNMYRLTQNQINSLTSGKHWEEKEEHVLKLLRSFGIHIVPYDLEWFMEKFVPAEQARITKEIMEARRSDKQGYAKVDNPVIGEKYHLAWATNGCVWKLIELLPNGKCIMITPKTKKRITANISDLLHLRKNSPQFTT